jgi:dihydroorotate dehydrogenase (NAD+) catalytic subunit
MTFDGTTSLGNLQLKGPVLTASGCAAAGKELDQFFDITQIGGIVTKSIMLEARSGRPTPRMAETPSGMLNSIGLQGPGIDSFIEKDLAWLHERGATTIVSIAGNSVDEFGRLASKLRDHPAVAAIEINISCPNVANRGLVYACNVGSASDVVSTVRRNVSPDMPLLAKLSPDVTDIVEIAQAVKKAGADGVSVINTVLGMVIDQKTLRPVLGGRTGGLSGPAIRPVAVRCVYQIHAAMPDFPILGMGGIRNGKDALEFIAAGASALSVGTATFGDPSAPMRVQNELTAEIENRGFNSISEVVGIAHQAGA